MNFSDVLLYVIAPILFVAVMLSFIRFLKGPTIPDRVVALDLMSTLGIGLITVFAMATDQNEYLDVAALMALTSFLGTIAFAYYVHERRIENPTWVNGKSAKS